MPLYEFQCAGCQVVFEELMPMGSTGESLNCPTCGHARVHKCMSTFSGRSSSGNGAYQSIGGSSCACGGDCGSCGDSCSCHH
ncbi:MAG: FmdB family zinc ribbon protein [Armatimonadota bacterium]